MEISEWDLLDFLKHNKRWFTLKELVVKFNFELCQVTFVKFNRKLNNLLRAKYIEYRKSTRPIAWRHENEYRYVGQKRKI